MSRLLLLDIIVLGGAGAVCGIAASVVPILARLDRGTLLATSIVVGCASGAVVWIWSASKPHDRDSPSTLAIPVFSILSGAWNGLVYVCVLVLIVSIGARVRTVRQR